MQIIARILAENFLLKRILPYIEITATGCWEWQGVRQVQGYGRLKIKSKKMLVHREVYKKVHNVALTTKELVCHSCDNPSCCNPDHLWLGTHQDNAQDMIQKGRYKNGSMLKTHCKHGHEFTPSNSYVPKDGKRRQCKTCRRRIDTNRRLKKRGEL